MKYILYFHFKASHNNSALLLKEIFLAFDKKVLVACVHKETRKQPSPIVDAFMKFRPLLSDPSTLSMYFSRFIQSDSGG